MTGSPSSRLTHDEGLEPEPRLSARAHFGSDAVVEESLNGTRQMVMWRANEQNVGSDD